MAAGGVDLRLLCVVGQWAISYRSIFLCSCFYFSLQVSNILRLGSLGISRDIRRWVVTVLIVSYSRNSSCEKIQKRSLVLTWSGPTKALLHSIIASKSMYLFSSDAFRSPHEQIRPPCISPWKSQKSWFCPVILRIAGPIVTVYLGCSTGVLSLPLPYRQTSWQQQQQQQHY